MLRLLALFILVLASKAIFAKVPELKQPENKNAVFDLAQWNFQEAGPIRLDGDWRIVWHEFIDPNDPKALLEGFSRGIAQAVPGDWRTPPNNLGFGRNQGFATILLRVSGLSSQAKAYDLSTRTVGTAYRLAIAPLSEGGAVQWVLEAGVPGTSPQETTPYLKPMVGNFVWTGAGDAMLVMHLANFDHREGGVHSSIWLGEGRQAAQISNRARISEIIALAMIFIIGVYNFALFLQRPEDFSSLWLFAYCFSTIVRGISSTAMISDLIPSNERWVYELKVSLEYSTISLNTCLLGMFLVHCFPKFFSRRLMHIFLGLALVQMVFAFVIAPYKLTQYLSYYQILLAVSALYLLVSWLRAVYYREPGAFLGLSGGLVLLACAVHDVLVSRNIIFNPFIGAYGLVVFLLLQSLVIGQRFAKAFRQAEFLSRSLRDEVERQTRDIKSILQHIRQGIFSITRPHLTVDEQHSTYMNQIFGPETLAGQNLKSLLLQRVELSNDDRAQIESALEAILGDDAIAYELNESALKSELVFRKTDGADAQILELEWSPVLDRQMKIEKILVCVRDVTEVRQLKLLSERREHDLKMILELIQIPEDRFQRFYQRASEQILENMDLIRGDYEPKSDIVRRLFINMHTIKGSARTYYLNALSTLAHDLEQNYAALQRKESSWDHELLLKNLEEIQELLNRYQSIGEERLGWSLLKKSVKIERRTLQSIITQLKEIITTRSSDQELITAITEQLSKHSFDTLGSIADEAFRGTDSIARDLGKPTPLLQLNNDQILLHDRASEVLYNCFLHLFRNSIDHGIEPAESRLQKNKSAEGNIRIEATLAGHGIVINYRDDGVGLALESIQAKAIERGLMSKSRSYTRTEIAAFIFISGFSTKSAVSEISGRGVGLDAVRTYVEGLGGTISIHLELEAHSLQVPFYFQISLPKEYLWGCG